MSIKAESGNGSIEFVGDGVIIRTKGGSKVIPLDEINHVEYKPAGRIWAGYIRLSVPAPPDAQTGTAQKDEELVFSERSRNTSFKAVADAIQRAAFLGRPPSRPW